MSNVAVIGTMLHRAARMGVALDLHEESCSWVDDASSRAQCNCKRYEVAPGDPRPAAEILLAALRWQRSH